MSFCRRGITKIGDDFLFNRHRDLLNKKELDPKIAENLELEKNDFLAITIAAASVFIPAFLAIMGGIALIILVMFYR